MNHAVSLLEMALGFSLSPVVLTERCGVTKHIGRLTRKPLIEVLSVKARLHQYEFSTFFGTTDWIDIPVESVRVGESAGQVALHLPFTVFGGSYDEAEIVYTTGYGTYPDDIRVVIDEIESLWSAKTDKDGWSVLSRLSKESWLTIRAYKGVQ